MAERIQHPDGSVTVDGRRERWVLISEVGGWVCAEPDPNGPDGECGMPVETESCSIHYPGLADR